MKQDIVEKAAAQFGTGKIKINALGSGIINRTYKADFDSGTSVVLQCINQNTFPQPENIINNYRELYEYMNTSSHRSVFVPKLLPTIHGKLFWIDETENFWRATEYVRNTYTITTAETVKQAREAAHCFGCFANALAGMDMEKLNNIIPGFHDLSLRYKQFEDAVAKGDIKRLLRATHLIAEARQRKTLVDFYQQLKTTEGYKVRVMHHDCKLSNILFNQASTEAVCPVDLDTTMPGYYFSDLGDMIRTMTCTVDENSTSWEKINVSRDLYKAVIEGYLLGIGSVLTPVEVANIHHCGLLMTYMQMLRFLADYLNYDIYYKTEYPEQNLNRALNQFIFLERLEEFLMKEYNYHPYSLAK